MTKLRDAQNRLKDESGVITLDFIFALSIAFGFSIFFFAISFSLSMVEVCQYVTYATARTYYAANVSQQAQVDLGKKKYEELKGKGIIKSLLKSGWIALGDVELGNFNSDYDDQDAKEDATFVGARVPFTAKVLNLRLPLLGNTASDSKTGSATLNAYLLREVSTEECRQNFTAQRYSHLTQLEGGNYQPFATKEIIITDNGC